MAAIREHKHRQQICPDCETVFSGEFVETKHRGGEETPSLWEASQHNERCPKCGGILRDVSKQEMMPWPFHLSIRRILVVMVCSVLYGFLVQVAAFDFMVTKASRQTLGEVQLFIHAARYALSSNVVAVGLALFAAFVAAASPRIDVMRWVPCRSHTWKERDGRTRSRIERPIPFHEPVGERFARVLVLCLGAEFGLIFAVWLAPTVASDLVQLRGIFARVLIGAISGLVSAAFTNLVLFRVCRRPG